MVHSDDFFVTDDERAKRTKSVDCFYTDRRNGWAVVLLDVEGNQIGEATYLYRKKDAMAEQKRLIEKYVKGGTR